MLKLEKKGAATPLILLTLALQQQLKVHWSGVTFKSDGFRRIWGSAVGHSALARRPEKLVQRRRLRPPIFAPRFIFKHQKPITFRAEIIILQQLLCLEFFTVYITVYECVREYVCTNIQDIACNDYSRKASGNLLYFH